jgi:hypothetical protein
VKVYAALILTAGAAAPALAFLIIGNAVGSSWIEWLAVPVGAGTGCLLAARLGSFAIARLARRGPEMLEALASSPAGRR